jgi:hypothetical protein
MRTSILMIATGIISAAAGAAEPPKAPVQKAEQTADNPPVLVASATEASVSPTLQQDKSANPIKPVRHARVTTCRCGDQNPSD